MEVCIQINLLKVHQEKGADPFKGLQLCLKGNFHKIIHFQNCGVIIGKLIILNHIKGQDIHQVKYGIKAIGIIPELQCFQSIPYGSTIFCVEFVSFEAIEIRYKVILYGNEAKQCQGSNEYGNPWFQLF